MLNKYIWLFPFEKIPKSSKILIYGAGDVGQEYLQQIKITGYCECIGFVDRAYNKYPAMIVPIYAPDRIFQLCFDYIVVAMKTDNYMKETMQRLIAQGIVPDKVICAAARQDCQLVLPKSEKNIVCDVTYAYEKTLYSIALKYGPGLGDCIIKKKLFEAIVQLIPDCKIDIYAPNGTQYIPYIYSDQLNMNVVIDDGGALYAQNYKKYMLAMKVFYLLQIDYIADVYNNMYNEKIYDSLLLLKRNIEDYGLVPFPVTQNWIHFGRAIYKGDNCYSLYNYTGIFHIRDTFVRIPLEQEQKDVFDGLQLKKYITFNYGNGTTTKAGKSLNVKQWPLEYFTQFVCQFKQKYPGIQVIQVGDRDTQRVQGADQYFLGENLGLVKYILKEAILHLDIEGGLMHLATQLGTKCVVLYGPTQAELFSYPSNINIVSNGCKGCYCLNNDMFVCARGLEKAECMYNISVTFVMKSINEYLIGEEL